MTEKGVKGEFPHIYNIVFFFFLSTFSIILSYSISKIMPDTIRNIIIMVNIIAITYILSNSLVIYANLIKSLKIVFFTMLNIFIISFLGFIPFYFEFNYFELQRYLDLIFSLTYMLLTNVYYQSLLMSYMIS